MDEPFTDTWQLAMLDLARLEPAGSETFTATWDSPETGSHIIYVGADPSRTVAETTRTNNLGSVATVVLQPGLIEVYLPLIMR